MTRAEIRTAVRLNLAESSEGYWTDADINSYIQLACDIHAQETHSVEWTQRQTSIGGVYEYALPTDMGELKDVRFVENGTRHQLTAGSKGRVLDGFTSSDETSLPREYAIDRDALILIPAPNTSAETEYSSTTLKDTDQEITATGNASLAQSFQTDSQENIAAARVSLSKIGNPTGNLTAYILNTAGLLYRNGTSESVKCADIEVWYEWAIFWWALPPVVPASAECLLAIGGDATYQGVYSSGITSVVWGVDGSSPTYTSGSIYTYDGATWTADTDKDAFFEVHPVRNDIEIDYYRAVTTTLSADTDVPDIPTRYHRHIVSLATAYAFRKDNFDSNLAALYEGEAQKGMLFAKAHAAQGTRSRRTRGASGPRTREGSIVVNNP